MKNTLSLLLLCLFLIKTQAQTVSLTPVNAPNTLNWLVAIAHAPNDDRLYAIQKDGFVRIVQQDGTVLPTPFLDLSAKVNNSALNEQGLLGLAFHPDYANNGFFYVFYNEINTGDCTISRYKRSLANPNVADPTEGVLLSWEHPGPYHVAGCMKFGPDGYLYISSGDGGGGGDPNGNGQNKLSFLGKILRIDVGDQGGAYSVPADNPFVGALNAAPEIWAFGLRNPWRFGFDSWTGDLWIGDVGQDSREEVDFQPSNSPGGENYGWSCKEGTLDFNPNQCFAGSVYTDPLYEYPNAGADCSITGGTVYRGTQYADLFGKYLFTDFCSGKIRALLNDGNPTVMELGDFNNNDFTALEADRKGELYTVGFNTNTIYRIGSNDCAPVAWLVAEPTIDLPLGGIAQLTAYGSGMNYQWLLDGNPIPGATSNTLTVADAGTYSVVVTNPVGGCSNTSNETVVTAPAPLDLVLEVQTPICFGTLDGSITAIASGGTQNYTYLWSTGETTPTISNLPGGDYSVTINDGNSSLVSFATIEEYPAFSYSIDAIAPTTSNNGVAWVTMGNGLPPFAVLWSTGETTDTIFNLAPGTYSVTIYDANGCEDSGTFVLLVNATSEPNNLAGLQISPNPVSDKLTISISLKQASGIGIALFDGMGRQVSTLQPYGQMGAGETNVQASMAALPPGVYFVVVNMEGEMVARKVVLRDEG